MIIVLSLAIGICQLELGQFEDALATFQKMINDPNHLYHEQGIWYSALIHLQLNNTSQAQPLLQSISGDKTNYFYNKSK